MNRAGQTVCLSMIVKDEAPVIRRCLESVLPYIDSYVICDTGSMDDTKAIIADVMKGIPGKVIDSEWVNFSHNRNIALYEAEKYGHYTMTIDADEILVPVPGKPIELPPVMDKDGYLVVCWLGHMCYQRLQLMKSGIGAKWIGVLHEYNYIGDTASVGHIDNFNRIAFCEGNRATNRHKFFNDTLTLIAELEKNPDDSRNVFYLAQCLRDCNHPELHEEAIRWYTVRFMMMGWHEELWYCLYQIAAIKIERMRVPWERVIWDFLRAYQYYPLRAEPLCALAELMNTHRQFLLASQFANMALPIPFPKKDLLFIDGPCYSWKLVYQMVYALFQLNDARWLPGRDNLLANNDLPAFQRENLAVMTKAWLERHPETPPAAAVLPAA